MIFLGNAASFHLDNWKRIYALCDEAVTDLYSIHPVKNEFANEHLVSAPAKPLAYLSLGLRLRSLPENVHLHAHGASGYGLAALLSGRPYIATIYGSEILGSHSYAYRKMMGAIIRGATAITVTSAAAKDRIATANPVAEAKTYFFHTGVDTEELASIDIPSSRGRHDRLRIMLLRNAAPHYRTKEVLAATIKALGDRQDAEVVIPFGNGDRAYFDEVKKQFVDHRLRFLEHPIVHQAYLDLVARSDICINFPVSDQVSTTLLEALYFDRVVVTNSLDAYANLLELAQSTGDWTWPDTDNGLVDSIQSAIARFESRSAIERRGRQLVIDHFSIANAARCFRPVLERIQ